MPPDSIAATEATRRPDRGLPPPARAESAASPDKRGETLAGLFLIAYLGLAVPAIGIGLVSRFENAVTAVTWFAGAVLALLVVVAAMTDHPQQHHLLHNQPTHPA